METKRNSSPIRSVPRSERSTNINTSPNKRTKRWQLLTTADAAGWKNILCCKKLKCFQTCNLTFLLDRVNEVIQFSNHERKTYLKQLLTSDGYFSFDNRRVCADFLTRSFKFSRDLQCAVKQTPGSRFDVNQQYGIRNVSKCSANYKEAIICFLQRAAENSSHKMPDSDEIHLPFKLKDHVYNTFKSEFTSINNSPPPSRSYFIIIWNLHCKHIKIRRQTRFSICATCDQLDDAILNKMSNRKATADLVKMKKEHMDFVLRERCDYRGKVEKAALYPNEFLSVIIDGADQSAFGLPHFVTSTKDQKGKALKVSLVGVLEHSIVNRLFLLTMTEEYDSGSNHIIESLHRFFILRASEGAIPPIFFVQMDNCTRENKNRYVMAYFQCLVCWGMFKDVQVSFLPVGHTHEDIDQSFSCSSKRLRTNNAITLNDLQEQLKKIYNSRTYVVSMDHVANFSGLCEQENVLIKVGAFSHFRYFRFTRMDGPLNSDRFYDTQCFVKCNSSDEWESFQHENLFGFVRSPPNLRNTPHTDIPSGQKADSFEDRKDDFTARLVSEEARINSTAKLADLYRLRDKVFQERQERFHWDVANSVELRHFTDCNNSSDDNEIENSHEPLDDSIIEDFDDVQNDYNYDLNSFVIVQPQHHTEQCPFWVGKVNDTYTNKNGTVAAIQVHWFMLSKNDTDIYSGRYIPSFCNVSKSGKVPWLDKIHVDTVIMNFADLLQNNRLPAAIHKKIRLHFGNV